MEYFSFPGTAIAVTVFSKLLKMHDAAIGVIATACKVVSSFVYGFAPTRNWFYTGPAFDFFGNSGVTAIRSLGTKVVHADEVGKTLLSFPLSDKQRKGVGPPGSPSFPKALNK